MSFRIGTIRTPQCRLCGLSHDSHAQPYNPRLQYKFKRQLVKQFASRGRRNKFSDDDSDKPQYDYDEQLKQFIPDEDLSSDTTCTSMDQQFSDFGSLLDTGVDVDEEFEEEEEIKQEMSKKVTKRRGRPPKSLIISEKEVFQEDQESEGGQLTQEQEDFPGLRTQGRRQVKRRSIFYDEEDEEEEEEEEEEEGFTAGQIEGEEYAPEEYDEDFEDSMRRDLELQLRNMGQVQYQNWAQMNADQDKMIDEALTIHHDQLENANSRFLLTLEYARILEDLDLEEAAMEEAGDVPLDVTKPKFPLWVQANYKLNENYDEWNKEQIQVLEQMQRRQRKREMEEVARELIGIDVSGVLQNKDFANIEYRPPEVIEKPSTMELLFQPVRELVEEPVTVEGSGEQDQFMAELLPEPREERQVEQEDYSGEQ